MKGSAFILLLIALAYFGESVRVPYYMAEQAKAEAGCCHMEKGKCTYEYKSKSSSNECKGCCNTTANCTNCPLCYTAELASLYTSAEYSFLIRQSYPDLRAQPLADYTASSWKPPNA